MNTRNSLKARAKMQPNLYVTHTDICKCRLDSRRAERSLASQSACVNYVTHVVFLFRNTCHSHPTECILMLSEMVN